MSFFISSGWIGVAGQNLTLTATAQDVELLLPSDLAVICNAFANQLGITKAYSGFDLPITETDTLYIELLGPDDSRANEERELRIRFWLFKQRSRPDFPRDSNHADYTVNRLLRLIEANSDLAGLAGINGINQISTLCGSDADALLADNPGQISIALIDVTYSTLSRLT